MSFLSEYCDEFRQYPIRKTIICRPENRFATLEGKWLDPKVGTDDKKWTDEEIQKFIKNTMHSLRGQSGYYNDYCAHLSQEFKTRPFKPRAKTTCRETAQVPKTSEVEEAPPQLEKKLSIKDTELMKSAEALYGRDMNAPTLRPLPTQIRILGYSRPWLYKTGNSVYSETVARLAYELVRDDRLPPYEAHNGARPRWGLPPEGQRQPELDAAPYISERLY